MTARLDSNAMQRPVSKKWCQLISCDRGVMCYELNMTNLKLKGCSLPVQLLVVDQWNGEARESLLEKTSQIAARQQLMIVGAGNESVGQHAWKELPVGVVYLDDRTLQSVMDGDDTNETLQSHIIAQLGIRYLNPIAQPDSIDPVALINRDMELQRFREIDVPSITIPGPPSLGKSVFARQVFSRRETTFVNCLEYKWDPENESDFASFLGQNLPVPTKVQSVDEFTTTLIKQSTSQPVLVLDNVHAGNFYRSPSLSCLSKSAAAKQLRLILIGQNTVFPESKWLRPYCKTEAFILPHLSDIEVRQFVLRLFGSLQIRLADRDQAIGELIAMSNGLPGKLMTLCNSLITVCLLTGRQTVGFLDVYRCKNPQASSRFTSNSDLLYRHRSTKCTE